MMIEPDPTRPVPYSWEGVKKLWQELEITPAAFEPGPVRELLANLSDTHASGGPRFACFHLSDHPILNWYGSRNSLIEIDFFRDFLTHPVVMAFLPELKITKPLSQEPEVELGSSFTLDGELAEVLVNGGAYRKLEGPAGKAKQIGRAFCESLYGERFDEVQIYKTWTPWSSWFGDVAWDGTWFGLDKRQRFLWLLCVTDED